MDYRTKKDQKKIKGTTKPLMANLDITLLTSLVCEKQALSHSTILEAVECLYPTVNAWEGETGDEASNTNFI